MTKPQESAAPPYDVAIIGGGPAGSTAAAILLKYAPHLRVLVLEKEVFPRPHIGESQLPAICPILNEMGVWDKVEAANFPIKLGASLTWGRNNDSWDFDFYPVEEFKDEPRPAKYEGQRHFTAFQVDRPVYDEILLDHAASLGAEVREGTQVRDILRDGGRCAGLRLDSGEVITAKHYIDASGTVGILRRGMGVEIDCPIDLRNIAIWDYWENAEWAVKIGVGGTRIQVRSLPYGWIWFIPLGPTRTSLGLVCPAEYYKASGKTPEQLYMEAVNSQPTIAALLKNATRRGEIEARKDWSTLAEKIVGDNWFLIGESAGFADPILSAGMTLAHTQGREVAYIILELERGELDAGWMKAWYNEKGRANINQHIRFAQYWYVSNGCFTELQENCAAIARESGLRLKPAEAWGWLARGGFTNEDSSTARFGSFDLASTKILIEKFIGGSASFGIEKFNVFRLNVLGADKGHIPVLDGGRIKRVECYKRRGRALPLTGTYANLVQALRLSSDGLTIANTLVRSINMQVPEHLRGAVLSQHIQAWEAMLADQWLDARLDPKKRVFKIDGLQSSLNIRPSEVASRALAAAQAARRGELPDVTITEAAPAAGS